MEGGHDGSQCILDVKWADGFAFDLFEVFPGSVYLFLEDLSVTQEERILRLMYTILFII